MFKYIREQFALGEIDIVNYSPLTLAYIGDAIYEIVIRTMIVAKGNCAVEKLHKKTTQLVKAKKQAEMIQKIENELSEEEERIFKRGRNAKSYTMAKNATMKEYRLATGFEALMGYLYMTEQEDRMMELIRLALGE